MDPLSQHSERVKSRLHLSWFWLCLLCVFFAPPIILPGNIPLRVDDLIVAGVAGLMAARWLLRLRSPSPDGLSGCLILMALTMPLSAYIASRTGTLPIGPKEYLDFVRPLKFLFLFLALRRTDGDRPLQTLRRSFHIALPVLAVCALVQFLLLRPGSSGILANGFLLFTELPAEQARSYYGVRSFATFHTPTDLGYVCTLFLAESLVMPTQHKWWVRVWCLITLILSNTRTFLFALPVLFAITTLMSDSGGLKKLARIGGSAVALAAIGIFIYFVGPMINPDFSANITRDASAIATGDYASDDSIAVRLHKLELVVYTWEHARYFGVGSREMLGSAADSEYVFTFNRYGLVGISLTLALYLAGLGYVRRLRHRDREMAQFAALVLFTTFVYGFTQGALINTRTGILAISVIGIAAARARRIAFKAGRAMLWTQEAPREDLPYFPDPSAP